MARAPKKTAKRKYTRKAKIADPITVEEANKWGSAAKAQVGYDNGGYNSLAGGLIGAGHLGNTPYASYPAQKIDYYQTKHHVAALQREFPGIWIRADGAIRTDEIDWSPLRAGEPVNSSVVFGFGYDRKQVCLKPSQLRALYRYIEVEGDVDD